MPEQSNQFHFKRAIEANPDAEQIFLPERIEEELLDEAPGKPLDIICGRFREAGITQETITRYKAAVKAFMAERGSAITLGNYPSFSPQDKYFSTFIEFSKRNLSLPDLLRNTPLKPRLGKEGKREFFDQQINGSEILAQMETMVEKDSKRTAIAPIERTLTKLNRAMYAFHEPIHILQSIVPGDQLNRLKDHFPIAHLINQNKEQEYLREVPGNLNDFTNFDALEKSLFISPLFKQQKNPQTNILIANNEATMDALQDEAVAETLKQHPETLLWIHNMLSLEMEALRTLRQELLSPQDRISDTFNKKEGLINHLEFLISFMDRAYFAAFSSSTEAERWLLDAPMNVLGREVSGAIAHVDTFNQTDILNVCSDIKTILERYKEQSKDPDDPYTRINEFDPIPPAQDDFYTFPSGRKFLKKGISDEGKPISPMTSEGVAIASRIAGRMAEQNKTSEELHDFFIILQRTLEGTEGGNPAEEIEKLAAQATEQYGFRISENDLRECYGIADYIQFNDFAGTYYYKAFLRKQVLKEVSHRAPEKVNEMIREMFFEPPFEKNQFLALSGFGYFVRATAPDYKSKWETHPLDTILQQHDLSIFSIDATELNPEDRALVEKLYQDVVTSTATDYAPFVESLAQIKRRQQ